MKYDEMANRTQLPPQKFQSGGLRLVQQPLGKFGSPHRFYQRKEP